MRASDTAQPRQRRERNVPSRIILHGDIALVEVHLDGTAAMIDAADVHLVAGRKWTRRKGGVRQSAGPGQPQPALHRVVLGMAADDVRRVDHVNGNTLDNRRCNLRVCDAAQNGWNRTRRNQNNTSGVPGVSRNRSGWMAYVDVRRKRIYLGTFPTLAAAAAARRTGEIQHFGEWAPHGVTSHRSPARGDAGGDAPIVKRT